MPVISLNRLKEKSLNKNQNDQFRDLEMKENEPKEH